MNHPGNFAGSAGKAVAQAVAAKQALALAFRAEAEGRPALLLIHGWGTDSSVWRTLQDALAGQVEVYALDLPGHGVNAQVQCASADEFCRLFMRDIEAQLPPRYSVLGWSLGGMLAAKLAAFSNRIVRLVTVATNPSFVARADWPAGMDPQLLRDFSEGITADACKALRRFYTLQTSGTISARSDLRCLQTAAAEFDFDTAQLSTALEWLATEDVRDCYRRISVPVVHYFGAHDALVPRHVAAQVAAICPAHAVRVFAASAHAPFLSEPDAWHDALIQDLSLQGELRQGDDIATSAPIAQCSAGTLLDKHAVANAFSKAAANYELHAGLQREVGEQLCRRLQGFLCSRSAPTRVLDAGSGPGLFARRISALLPATLAQSEVVALDLSMGMLQQSVAAACVNHRNIAHLQADFDALPLSPHSFDAIFANFALQWCEDFASTLQGLAALLRPGGELVLSTLAEGSLAELREAWASVDTSPHVNRFAAPDYLHECVQGIGLELLDFRHNCELQYFLTSDALLQSVKGIGAGNHLKQRERGLLGVRRYRKFLEVLDAQRDASGRLALSYQVVQIHLRREPIV